MILGYSILAGPTGIVSVEFSKPSKQRVTTTACSTLRVYVNGKESWTGTEKQFQSLIIDTGDGDDVVNDNVGNAMIVTGAGNDRVNVYASGSTID